MASGHNDEEEEEEVVEVVEEEVVEVVEEEVVVELVQKTFAPLASVYSCEGSESSTHRSCSVPLNSCEGEVWWHRGGSGGSDGGGVGSEERWWTPHCTPHSAHCFSLCSLVLWPGLGCFSLWPNGLGLGCGSPGLQ